VKGFSIIGASLSIIGFVGALYFSPIFFGIFTVGLFLVVYGLTVKKEEGPQKIRGSPSLKKPAEYVEQLTRFCPICGGELDKGEEFCPLCGEKVKKGE
jgi:ribosomal protein S27AE